MKATPTVNLTSKVEGFLKGTLLTMGKEVMVGPNKDWKYFVYELAILDTDLPVTIKGTKGYEETSVGEGDKVAIFATKKLNELLSVFVEGTNIVITYKGKKDSGATHPAHDFSVKLMKAGK